MFKQILLTTVLALALAGCQLGGAAPTATTTPAPSPQPSATAAPADTATLAPTASATETPTLAAATAAAAAAAAATELATATPAVTASATAVVSPTAAVTQAAGTDKADFVADVTAPDGTAFTSGQMFVKTWRLKNAGTNDWTPAYALVFVRGDHMGGPATVALSETVAAGTTADISVNLTAPNKLGTFTGFWMLRNAAGKLFGLSADANQPVYLKIIVGAAAGTPQPTAVPGALSVTAVTLNVDQASFTGACPRTFTFNGGLTSSGAGTISYQLEASSDKPGFAFTLPKPVNSPMTGVGPRTFAVQYQLQFTSSVSGQAWLHVMTPSDLSSDKVHFSLTCQP